MNYQHLVLTWLPGLSPHSAGWATTATLDVTEACNRNPELAALLTRGFINDFENEEHIPADSWSAAGIPVQHGPRHQHWRNAPPIVEVRIDPAFGVPKKRCLACKSWMESTHYYSVGHCKALVRYNHTPAGWQNWERELAGLFTNHWRLAGR